MIRKKLVKTLIICLVWAAFACAGIYIHARDELPKDDGWHFSVDPSARLEPVQRFFEDNPVRNTLMIGHNLPVWIMSPQAPSRKIVKFDAIIHVTPRGFTDMIFETEADIARVNVRLSNSDAFESAILFFRNGVVEKKIPLRMSAEDFSAGADVGTTSAILSQWSPRTLPGIKCEVAIDQNTIKVSVNERQVGQAVLEATPIRAGFMALGTDYPVYVDSVHIAFLPDNTDELLVFEEHFGMTWSGIVIAGMLAGFTILFVLLAGLAAGMLAKRAGQEALKIASGSATLFWPVMLTPFVPGGAVIAVPLLVLAVFAKRYSAAGGYAKSSRLAGFANSKSAFLAFALALILIQLGAFIAKSDSIVDAIAHFALTVITWLIPVGIGIYAAGLRLNYLRPILVKAFFVSLLLLVFAMVSAPHWPPAVSANIVFAILSIATGRAIFKAETTRLPNTALFILAILVVVPAEGALNVGLFGLAGEKSMPAIYQADEKLFWKLKGRPVPFSQVKSADEKRVISLGGSVTWGDGLLDREKAYPGVLEVLLNSSGGEAKWTVMNAGVPGYCSLQGRIALEDLIKHKPDFVTVCFGVNEYNESGFNSTLVEFWDRTRGQKTATGSIQKVLRRSALYNLLISTMSARDSGILERGGGFFAPNTRPDEFKRMLADMNDICKKNSAHMVMLKEAHLQQLFGEHIIDDYQAAMGQLAGELGIPILDNTANLKKHRNDDMLLDSIHPTGLYHKRIADSLAGLIRGLAKNETGDPGNSESPD